MAAKKQEVKKMTKAEQMMAAAAGISSELVRINGLGPLEIYVKTLTFAEFMEQRGFIEKLSKNHTTYIEERSLACDLYDVDGNYYFDPENDADMKYLHDMPYIRRLMIGEAIGIVNGGFSIPKNSETTEQK